MTGFVGLSPSGLRVLADTVDGCAQHLSRIASEVRDQSSGPLQAASRDLGQRAEELRWRSRMIEQAQAGSPGLTSQRWLADFAGFAVFRLPGRDQAFAEWRDRAWLLLMQEADPGAVATAFAARDDAEQLATTYPDLVGGLDGAPPQLRYLANAILIEREIDRLHGLAAEVADRDPTHILLRRIEDRIERYLAWESRQILLFDPSGDGRVVEVFGDLVAADRVAVVVPGMANDLDNFANDDGLRQDAIDLYEATCQDGVATIAWLGYDTPDGIDAVSRAAAQQGAPALSRFLAGIGPGRTITVVAHSYGSVLAGIAAADGIEADNLVVVGSPGTTLAHASDALLRNGGQVWSALASGDPVSLAADPVATYRRWSGLLPLLPTTARSLANVDRLWHGANPVAERFGALRITTAGSFGHTGYFTGATLTNLALIVEGRYSDVELEPRSGLDPAPSG